MQPPPGDADAEPNRPSGNPLYLRVESLHLRQGLQRAVPLVGALALNGAGWLEIPGLPRSREAAAAWGLPAGADLGICLAGGALIAAAACLRAAAKGVLVRKRSVTTSGPYARVRHPYYLANLLGSVGILLLAGLPGVLAAVVWLAAALPVFLLTIRGEEEGLSRLHGAAWDEYAARVPRLLPSLRTVAAAPGPAGPADPPTDPPATRGRWDNLVAEHEPPRLARFLAGAFAVASCRCVGVAAAALGGTAVTLLLASHVVARATRRPR